MIREQKPKYNNFLQNLKESKYYIDNSITITYYLRPVTLKNEKNRFIFRIF